MKKKAIACIGPLLITILTGCEHEVPAFTTFENSGTAQVDIWGDSAKEASVYLNYENGRLIPVLSWYSDRDSVQLIRDVSVVINGLEMDSITLVQGEFPGALKCVYVGSSYPSVMGEIVKDADSLTTSRISMQAQRYYIINESELQDSYTVDYIFTTLRGTKKGEIEFQKTTKTIAETMRFH